jgi:hypothetical protein
VRRRRIANLLVLAVAAFVIAFAVARAAAGDNAGASDPPTPRAHAPVAIENLERMPDIKPLRSVAGGPPGASEAPATTTPAPAPAPAPGATE